MAKRCPSCGYGPIGPFIDNCPICAEPVRNVRSGGGGYYRGGGGGTAPWVKWVAGGAIAAVVGVVGCCGIGMWNMGRGWQNMMQNAQKAMEQAKAEREADRRTRTVTVAAGDLIKEFQDNPGAADKKYKGKYLEITGVVERTGRDRSHIWFIILNGGDEGAKVKIECFLDDYLMGVPDDGRVRQLNTGQTVTVRGEYEGQVSNVQLHEGSLGP
jgi:hypothetical protein